MFGIENEIRYIAKKHANSYCIGIFFTARETYRSHHHSGCLRTKADALSELCLHIAGRLEHMPDDEEKEKAQKLLAEHQAEMAFDEEREKVQKLLAEHQAEMEKLKQTEMQPEESAGLELDKSQARKPVTYYGLPESGSMPLGANQTRIKNFALKFFCRAGLVIRQLDEY